MFGIGPKDKEKPRREQELIENKKIRSRRPYESRADYLAYVEKRTRNIAAAERVEGLIERVAAFHGLTVKAFKGEAEETRAQRYAKYRAANPEDPAYAES